MKTSSKFYLLNKYSSYPLTRGVFSVRVRSYSEEAKGYKGSTKTKIQFSETKNKKLKHKINYLHAFWRLNIGDLDLSLSTQLFLKKWGINSVYSLHYFILKKSSFSLFSKEQQNEIRNIYYKFGFNNPFIK